MSLSGLASVPDSDMLHQPHQVRSVDSPGDRFLQILNFDSPAFGRSNRVFIPPLEVVPEQMWIEFDMRLENLGATETAAAMINTQSWLGSSGAQLLYKATSVYTMSEVEAAIYNQLNSENADQREHRLRVTGAGYQSSLAAEHQEFPFVSTPNTVTQNRLFYMDLRPLVEKVLGNVGSMNAYAANAWSVDINLRNLKDLVVTAVDNARTTVTANIASMRLFLVGHREDAANAMRVSAALAKDGVKTIFEQSNHARTIVPSADAGLALPITLTMSEVEGECTDIVFVNRAQAGLTAIATTIQSANSPKGMDFVGYERPQSTLELGTQSNPVRVFGQAVAVRSIRALYSGPAYEGCSEIIQTRPNGDVLSTNSYVIAVPLCEKASAGQKYGMFSGSLRLKNDFRATFRWDALEARGADVLDQIVYLRRVLVITHAGIIMVNEE